MSNIIRVCNPFDFEHILSISRNRFTGPLSQFVNSVLDFIEAKGNVTLHFRSEQDGVGEPIEGSSSGVYDGCIGLLQRNESDLMAQLHEYPMNAVDIKQGDVTSYSTIAFVSLYEPRTTKEVSMTSIDDCFSIFNGRIYSICIAFTLLIYSVVYIRMKLFKRLYKKPKERKNQEDEESGCTLYELVTHLTGYGSISDSSLFMKIIFMVSCIYSFLVLAMYFCGFISTELITVDPPLIYTSYGDLTKATVSILFMKGWNTYKAFKFAPENSKKYKLWRMGVERYGEDNLFLSADDASSLVEKAQLIIARQSAMAFDSSFTPLILNDFCGIANDRVLGAKFASIVDKDIDRLQPFVSIDPNERLLLKGIIYSEHFRGPLFKLLRDRLITLRENGLIYQVLRMLMQTGGWIENLQNGDQRDPSAHGKIRQCLDGVIQVPEVDLQGVTVANVRSFILLCFYAILLQFFVLLIEVLAAGAARKRNKCNIRCTRMNRH